MVTFILIELTRRVAVGGRDLGGRVLGGRFEHTYQSYNYGLLFYCNMYVCILSFALNSEKQIIYFLIHNRTLYTKIYKILN